MIGDGFIGHVDDVVIYEHAGQVLPPVQIKLLHGAMNVIEAEPGKQATIAGTLRDNDNHPYFGALAFSPLRNVSLSHMVYNATSNAVSWVPASLEPPVPGTALQAATVPATTGWTGCEIAQVFIASRTAIDGITVYMAGPGNASLLEPCSIVASLHEVYPNGSIALVPIASTQRVFTNLVTVMNADPFDAAVLPLYCDNMILGKRYAIVLRSSDSNGDGVLDGQFSLAWAATSFDGIGASRSRNWTTSPGAWVENGAAIAIELALGSAWDADMTGFIDIDHDTNPNDAVRDWQPWAPLAIGQDGFFGISFDPATQSVTFLAPGEYAARFRFGPINESAPSTHPRYASAYKEFTLVVKGGTPSLAYLGNGTGESSMPRPARTYKNTLFTDMAGSSWTEIRAEAVFGDPCAFSFKMTDSYGQPVGNRPVWLQISIAPHSNLWISGATQDYWADSNLDWLRYRYADNDAFLQDVLDDPSLGRSTVQDIHQGIPQPKLGLPAFYPWFTAVDELQFWGPSV